MALVLRYKFFIFAVILLFSYPVGAEIREHQFCVFNIENGEPTKDDVNATWRMVNHKIPLPDYPYPLFTRLNRGGVWMINGNREWVEYAGNSPKGFLDEIKQEPWSKRTIVVRMDGDEDKVLVLNSKSEDFEIIDSIDINRWSIIDGKTLKSFSGPYILESRKETLVQSGGKPYIVSDKKLEPWSEYEKLEQLGITNIFSIYDAPALGGIVILTRDWELYLYYDGKAQKLIQFSDEVYGSLINLADIDAAVFLLQKSVYLFKKDKQMQKVNVQKLNETNARGAGKNYRYLEQYSQIIRYNPDLYHLKYGVERLTQNGFEQISNEKSNAKIKLSDLDIMNMITDVPAMNLTIFNDGHNISLYNGNNFINVLDNYQDILGASVKIIPLPSIQKIIILSSKNGIFELKLTGEIQKINLDINVNGLLQPEFIDWPNASAVLVITSTGLYSLDKNFNLSRVDGGEDIRSGFNTFFVAFIPALDDIVLKTRKGLVSVINTVKSDHKGCNVEAQEN